MKLVKSLYGILALACTALSSCDINEAPEFSDSDAFVAFTKSSMSVGEDQSSIEVPVMLTSFGMEAECTVTVDMENSTAVEGKNFTIDESSKTLKFTKDAPTQYVKINVIDNDTFDGDVSLTLGLMAQGLNVGANKTCKLTITDNEHPLKFILNGYLAKGTSEFNGETEWEIELTKDESDVNKVWISNLVPEGTSLKVYGVVTSDKKELHIPVGQEIAKSSSYPHILLEGFYGLEGESKIPSGGYITVLIDEDGTLRFQDCFGSDVYTDDACTNSAGWYNLMLGDIVCTKK